MALRSKWKRIPADYWTDRVDGILDDKFFGVPIYAKAKVAAEMKHVRARLRCARCGRTPRAGPAARPRPRSVGPAPYEGAGAGGRGVGLPRIHAGRSAASTAVLTRPPAGAGGGQFEGVREAEGEQTCQFRSEGQRRRGDHQQPRQGLALPSAQAARRRGFGLAPGRGLPRHAQVPRRQGDAQDRGGQRPRRAQARRSHGDQGEPGNSGRSVPEAQPRSEPAR